MKIEHLLHKHGGRITEIRAVGHHTWKGVASWHLVGNVKWDDGTESEKLEIPPFCLARDGSPEAVDELAAVLESMNAYLSREGEWHDMKHKRDGRAYSWTPKNAKNELRI